MARKRPASTIDYVTPARQLAAMSDPARMQILDLLRTAPDLGMNVTQLTAAVMQTRPLSQPTISHHLGRLLSDGLVSVEKRGVHRWYQVDLEQLELLASVVEFGVAR